MTEASPDCTARGSFTSISFDNASLVHSNLGGMGGRCSTPGLCLELETPTTPRQLLYEGLGRTSAGSLISMRGVNESEYRAWRYQITGIKRQTFGSITGFFGVINLLGPRDREQRPPNKFWSGQFTTVQLRYSFEDENSAPISLERTYLSFYDLDTGTARFDGSFRHAPCTRRAH